MTNKTVTLPLADRLEDIAQDLTFMKDRNTIREAVALLAAPVVVRQEPVAWGSSKPSAPGAYWARGNGLVRDALIQVIEEEGELRCNLHIRTTEDDFRYGYSIDQLSDEFEWLGPLYTSPPAPVAPVHSCGLDVHVKCGACLDKVKDQPPCP